MLAYAVVAGGLIGWLLRDVPLPTVDLSSGWVVLIAFAAMPLTLLLAIAASRWMPGPGQPLKGRMLAV